MDARGDEPAWTTHARRIAPGQSITINRDDDPEEGDIGLRRNTTSDLEKTRSRNGEDDSGGSSSSRTVHPEGEDIEMSEKRIEPERERMEDGERVEEGEQDGNADGTRTPPVMEYREGHHLIIERKRNEGDEVRFSFGKRCAHLD